MTITHSTDHLERALANLISQFKNKTAVEALVQPVAQVQQVEDALIDVLNSRSLSTAVGAQLDGLGYIAGVERGGRGDAEYRTAISLQIKVNNSRGTAQDLLDIIELWTNSTADSRWRIQDSGVASFIIELVEKSAALDAGEIAILTAYLREARAAGVYAYVVYPDTTESSEQYLSFGPNPDADGDSFGLDNGAFTGAVLL